MLDAHFITLPLKTVLACPNKYVRRRLTALEV